MSREALSLDISRLVSRVVSGETIDTAERGAVLAAKYPDLGMSGELIGRAIERTAGMVGVIRNAPDPAKPSPDVAEAAVASHSTTGNGRAVDEHQADAAGAARTALPVAAQSIDDDLAAAIDAEIGNLVSGHRVAPAAPVRPNGETHAPTAAARATAVREPANGILSRGPVAAFRRALFRT